MPFPDLSHRHREAEWMDADSVDPNLLTKSLTYIRRINRLLGYTRATLRHLEHLSHGWKKGQRISIVDIATGSADIPRAILRWADQRGFDIQIVGLDRHPLTARAAKAASHNPRLTIVQGDAFVPPFKSNSFDYAITAMFLHHLDDDAIVTAMVQMDRLARRGVIIADLLRSRRAYAWITLFTATSNPMVKHDARASVRQALSVTELLQLRDRAGLQYTSYHRHFGHRFVLVGEKQNQIDPRS